MFNQNLPSIQIMTTKVTEHAELELGNHDDDAAHIILWARINEFLGSRQFMQVEFITPIMY